MLIGVDCGKNGGVAVLDGRQFLDGIRMPILKHGKRDVVDTTGMTRWLPCSRPEAIVIEQVSAMPRQGLTSTFNFGRHTGAVEGWALGWKCPVYWVTPQKWKKHFGLSKDKRASIDRARLEFGDDPLWSVLANDGIAEAALIALWWHNQNSSG